MKLLPTFDNRDRVTRGGSWINPSQYARVAFRFGWSASYRYSFLGFRPCLSVR